MIRLVSMIRRKPGASLADFQAWWRDVHGPLVAAHQATLGLARYSQAHRVVDAAGDPAEPMRAARGGMEPPFDGVGEYWFWSEAALAAALARPEWAALIEHERAEVDLSAGAIWIANEYPQVSVLHERPLAKPKSGVLKLHFPIRPLPSLTTAEAQDYWLTVHGPFVRSHAAARGMIAYQQVHRRHSPFEVVLRAQRGIDAPPYIGHAEAWFDRLLTRAGPEADRASGEARADEDNFIDFSRSSIWFGKELLFVDRDW